ncbi:MAG TPA: TonB-dependent receptor [Flavihumibacter sp.]|jgi:TonB-linked SusC/RagA family outer membrane protein
MKIRLLPKVAALFVLLITCVAVYAQKPIRGKVTSSDGTPVAGASILIKSSGKTITTDAEGNFSADLNEGEELTISHVGFADRTVVVGSGDFISVEMTSTTADLQQVVVVGYGTQRKKDLTGAVSVVDPNDLKKRQATTVAEAMQGLASGVYVRGSGRPGAEANIQIRGIKNLSNTNPLYVIDGLIATANRDFNPNDIESIQILKDASAAAIYGSRAANGVVIITTKRGRSGPMKVDISAKSSVQIMPRYDLAGREEFARLNYMAYDNAGVPRQELEMENNTDWQDAAYRTGQMHDLNASFSGGGQNSSYMVSGNYLGNKGTVIGTKFDRIGLRVNSQGTKGIFSIGENISITNAVDDQMSGNPVLDVVRLLPTIPVRDPRNPGGYGYGHEARARTFGTNPVAIADLEDREQQNLRIRGNLWSELKFTPWLKYRFNVGIDASNDHYKYLRKEGNWTLNQPYDPAIANENMARYISKQVDNTLTFNKSFGLHQVNLVVGQTYQSDRYEQIWGTKRNMLPNPQGGYYSTLDQGNEPQTGGYINEAVILSYLGRLEYNYDDRYLLNAVLRRDGTSRLGPDHRWGNFPSLSAAWRISRENFFNVDWIDDLKIRASYGTLGSSNIGYWDYLAVINTFSTIAMGTNQAILPGATQVRLANPDLGWEKLEQSNIGFDAMFLRNRLSVTAEYFSATTKDVLTTMPIAMTTGNDGGNPVVNAATLRNKGFEFSATFRDQVKDFGYSVGLNLTTLKNKVLELGYGRTNIYVGNTVTEIGQPLGMWYVLQTDGLFQNEQDVLNHKNKDGVVIQPNAKPGDIRFRDNNGDGQITNEDKVVVANPWPKLEMGLNIGASWKRLELTMNWFGSFGHTVYNSYRSVVDRFDDNSNYRAGIKPWTPENPNTKTPRALYASTLNSRGDSDRWLEAGDFFRMKYIGLTYAVPENLLKKVGFNSAHLSLSGQNLITFTKFTGLDPEFNNSSIYERGVAGFIYPNVKMVSLGLSVGF